jgi:hypothetical protein
VIFYCDSPLVLPQIVQANTVSPVVIHTTSPSVVQTVLPRPIELGESKKIQIEIHEPSISYNPSTLSEYFSKLADKTIPYKNKNSLKSGVLKFFTSPDAEVIKVINGNETGYETIKDYAETLCNTYRPVKILKSTMSSDRISKIYITEE